MASTHPTWLPLDLAAANFGYSPEGFRQRLRQLRQLGYVADTGRPPAVYAVSTESSNKPVVLLWPNPKTALIRDDAPRALFDPKRGKRASPKPP
jgi:hypothetical protein